MSGVLESINDVFKQEVVYLNFWKTGKHNPKKRKINLHDSQGEDMGGEMYILWEGKEIGGWFIYQEKSSEKKQNDLIVLSCIFPVRRPPFLKNPLV